MLKVNIKKNVEEINVFDVFGNRISYTLFGDEPAYIFGAIHNAILAKKIYPSWICRFYVEKPASFCNILKELSCEIIVPKDNIFPVAWRMYAIDDKRVDRVIFRDVDGILSIREKIAVDEWIESNKKFHRIKDSLWHYTPNLPILAGMWGAVSKDLTPINSLIQSFDWNEFNGIDRSGKARPDEHFINNVIWPLIKDNCLFHGIQNDQFGKAVEFKVPFEGEISYSGSERCGGSCNYIGSNVYNYFNWKMR